MTGESGWDGRVPGGDAARRRAERGPSRISAPLGEIARRMGVPGGSRTLTVVFARWVDVVGEGVAAHTEPVRLRGSTLVVAVDHPTWATQLRFLIPDMMRRLAELIGDGLVSEVEITVRPRRT